MKILHLLLFSFIAIFLSACDRNQDVPKQYSATETSEYKALLQASGGAYFERKLPEDLKSTDWIYVALAYSDGTKKNILGFSEHGVEFTSDTAKVYFFEDQFSGLPFVSMQISDDTMGKGATQYASKENWKAKVTGNRQGEFSEPMIRFSTKNSISPIGSDEIPEGCFDLILYIDPNPPES
jgi:hypothetical protein